MSSQDPIELFQEIIPVGSRIATIVISFNVLAPAEYKDRFMESSPGLASRDGY
jgi:hypothetical protein